MEMATFKVLGYWLDVSGWTSVIADAGITSTGVADSLIKATHLTEKKTSPPDYSSKSLHLAAEG